MGVWESKGIQKYLRNISILRNLVQNLTPLLAPRTKVKQNQQLGTTPTTTTTGDNSDWGHNYKIKIKPSQRQQQLGTTLTGDIIIK